MFDDQGHSLQHNMRSLDKLRSVAIRGLYGKQAGAIRPLSDLKVEQLKKELRARNTPISNEEKDELHALLEGILKGVLRVPALLLNNPKQALSSLNLQKSEVVASEPLHDLKGHIMNLLTELPHVLPTGSLRTQCDHVISCCLSKEKKFGADLRRAVIQVFLFLKDSTCSKEVLTLLHTIIIIGDILYSRNPKRTPRQLLRLYNSC